MAAYSGNSGQRLEDPVSNALKWILLAVAVGSFALFAWATVLTYERAAPQPDRFVAAGGAALMTADDILAGKAGFQKADLMDYGSLYGMGSYFGQDYTAFALVRLAKLTEEHLAQSRYGGGFDSLPADRKAAVRAEMQRQLQTLDLTQREVTVPEALASAIATLRAEMAKNLRTVDLTTGWTPAYSLDEAEAAHTAEFIIYSALTTVARRPDTTWSWTENWPYEPEIGNTPTANTFMWTWASFCFTFFAFGGVLFIYQHWLSGADEGPMDPVLANFRPLTDSQRRIGKYFIVVAAVLLLQIVAGTIMAHAYYDRRSFYGLDLHNFLPFNFLRDVHIQSPIIWIGVGWIGSGLFLAPAIAGGREARGQGLLVDLLFYVTLIIVAGALIGDWLGIMGHMGGETWFWFGNQGLSYIQLGRVWQIGFFAGLLIWSGLMFRALWPTGEMLRRATRQFWSGRIRLENLIWAATLNIAILYVFGMIPLTGIEKSFTITDFWRWWVVHLWVEQSFEFFAASMSAYLLMAVGLVSRQLAERAVYFELILIFLGGVLGTGHHLYWAGGPSMWVPLGSMFSFIEVLPLVLLIIEAIQQHRLIRRQQAFNYRLAYTYIIGAAFWNFVGAGVFGGGTLNAPLINYYEHGTFLTLNHAHTALFGAFGLLAIGLIYFCLRYATAERAPFGERLGIWAFWLYNGGLVLWILLNFFPIGWPQLAAVYEHGLAYARSVTFYDTTLFWQWMRLPGDVVFAIGALMMAWDFLIKARPLLPSSVARWMPGAGPVESPAGVPSSASAGAWPGSHAPPSFDRRRGRGPLCRERPSPYGAPAMTIAKFDSLYAGHVDIENVGYGGVPVNDRAYPNEHLASVFDKAEAMAKLMDRLGYDTFWMAEHHFQREGMECIPNVLMAALHLAHVTKNINLGCGFNITPMWHPLRLAEDYAAVDILTKGRVIFGVGRGYHTREVETFGAPLLDQPANRELFEEQVEIIFKAFNNESFSHKGKHYTLPPEVPYRGYQLKELTLVPRPLRLPVECWQPIQGGSERALDFMARMGIKGLVGGGSAEGGAMHSVVLKWQEAHKKLGIDLELGERMCFGFHFYIADSREQGIKEAAKYYEENMKMFGELRLVRALTEEQIEIMRDPRRAPTAKLPRVEDAINSGGFLCGSPEQIVEHLKGLERRYPGLDRVSVSLSVGVPKSVCLEQLERFGTEVIPAFQAAKAREPALA